MDYRIIVPAKLWAQDPAEVGFASGAPAGWAVSLDADGLGATIARDAASRLADAW